MRKSAKIWMLSGSVLLLLLSAAGIIYTDFLPYNQKIDFLQSLSVAIFIASILNLVFIPVFINRYRAGFRKWMRTLTICYPALIVILFILESRWFPLVPDPVYIPYFILVIIVMGIACLYLFVIDVSKAVTGIILLIAYIVFTLILRRIDSSIYDSHFAISFIMIACGMYLFGLNSVSTIVRNRYLQITSFAACLIIYLGSFLILNLSMTTRSSTYLIIYSILLFLFTLIVLISLPVSGYVDWSASNKSIFKKILIPWIFFLLLISIRFVFPGLNSMLFSPAEEEIQEFRLDDYPVVDKNGLEPD